MKIACLIQRKGGTIVDMGTESYHFAPDKTGVHCAEVKDPAHVARFLGIPEAYVEYGKEAAKPESDAALEPDETKLAPEQMSNAELINWGKAQGFNPSNKKSIQDYAVEHYGVELDDTQNPVGMVRDLVRVVVENIKGAAK